jgi:hypothetical protein
MTRRNDGMRGRALVFEIPGRVFSIVALASAILVGKSSPLLFP